MIQRKKTWKKLVSIFFPLCCPVCDEILSPEEVDAGIHLKCESKFYPVQGAVCMHCGRPFRKNLRIFSENNTSEYCNPADINKNVWNTGIYLDNKTQEYCRECIKRKYVLPIRQGGRMGIKNDNFFSDAVSSGRDFCISSITGKALYLYCGDIKQTMYRFKYNNKREYADFFAKQAIKRYPKLFFEMDAIIPVPMYLPKQRKRGYNQAESFARALSELTNIPVDTKLIKRIQNTTPQKELDDVERKNNLKNAFQIGKNIVKYKKVLVVDDIYTTGSTMEAVAEELRCIGISQIYVLSICIGEEL